MVLQRAGNVEFRTIRGTLSSCNQSGYAHMLIDDQRHAYLIENSKKSERLEHLIGELVEVKGLIETDLTPEPKIHVIHYQTLENSDRLM